MTRVAIALIATISCAIAGCGRGENWSEPLPNGFVLHVDSVQGLSCIVDSNSTLIIPSTSSLVSNQIGIDQVNVSGDVVYGHVRRTSPSETIGFFVLDTRSGARFEGLAAEQYSAQLQKQGVTSPILVNVLQFIAQPPP